MGHVSVLCCTASVLLVSCIALLVSCAASLVSCVALWLHGMISRPTTIAGHLV